MKMKPWAFFEGRSPLTTEEKGARIAELRQEINALEAAVTTARLDDPEAIDQEQMEETRMAMTHLQDELQLLEESLTEDGDTSLQAEHGTVLREEDSNSDLNTFSAEDLGAEIARLQGLILVHKSSDPGEARYLQERIEAAKKLLGI